MISHCSPHLHISVPCRDRPAPKELHAPSAAPDGDTSTSEPPKPPPFSPNTNLSQTLRGFPTSFPPRGRFPLLSQPQINPSHGYLEEHEEVEGRSEFGTDSAAIRHRDSAPSESSSSAAGLALTWIHDIKDDTRFLPGGPGALGGGESTG